jgi:hypothetical protein
MQKEKKTNGTQAGPRVVEVTFALEGAEAKQAYPGGDFNDWSPTAVRMIHHKTDERWEKRLSQNVMNNFGSTNSVVEGGE